MNTKSPEKIREMIRENPEGIVNEMTMIYMDFGRMKKDFEEQRDSLEKKNKTLETHNHNLTDLILSNRRDQFGRKSEKYNTEGMTPLFEGWERIGDEEGSEEEMSETADKDHGSDQPPASKPPKKKPRGKQKVVLVPPNVEREIKTYYIDENDTMCGDCGSDKNHIQFKETSRIDYRPGKLVVVIEKREVRGCSKSCNASMVTASGKPRLMPKCKAETGLLSHIVVSKVLDRSPLYHISQQFKHRYGVHISRQVMASWMIKLAQPLQSLVNLMNDEISAHDIASFDATTLQVLNEKDRKATTKSYAYCKLGGPPGKEVILFSYNAKNHSAFAKEEFEGFKGFIHVDADPFFKGLGAQKDVTLSLCNAHSRRGFEKICKVTKNKNGVAKTIMNRYQEVYRLEKVWKELSNEERQKKRLDQSLPIMADMKRYLEEKLPLMSKKSLIGKATLYFLNHYDGLIQFTNHGGLSPDNNHTEREIRPFVIARKNFIFCDSVDGADALAVHFSIVRTALQHGLEPKAYYCFILDRLPLCKTIPDYEALLPWNVKKMGFL